MRGEGEAEATNPYGRETARRFRLNPNDPDALFAGAAIVAARGRAGRAIQLLDRLSRVAPQYPGLWRFKARLYRELGDAKMERLCVATAERQEAEAGRP